MPEDMSEYMPDHMPEDMPDRMSNRMSEDMPDRMPEDLPDRMPEDMPEDMPDHMPEDMPDRMSNRMSEDMSDRMPEDLPVRKCINVMVGITRSKVIFFNDVPMLFGDVLLHDPGRVMRIRCISKTCKKGHCLHEGQIRPEGWECLKREVMPFLLMIGLVGCLFDF